MEYDIYIDTDGTVKFVYYDELKDLTKGFDLELSRASNIDPKKTEDGYKWFVDLSPVSGPSLGPFETREEAIEAEIVWLNKNYLSK